jgi:hypothetical protein
LVYFVFHLQLVPELTLAFNHKKLTTTPVSVDSTTIIPTAKCMEAVGDQHEKFDKVNGGGMMAKRTSQMVMRR